MTGPLLSTPNPASIRAGQRVFHSASSLALLRSPWVRVWAAACAGGHTHSAHIEAPQLVTSGPYAHVRNPIYLGSLVLGLRMAGLLGDPWLLIPHALVFAVFFGLIVPAEKQFLARQFGEEYERFRHAVPRFIPNFRRWTGRAKPRLAWRSARGEGFIALLLIAIYGSFASCSAFRISRFEPAQSFPHFTCLPSRQRDLGGSLEVG